MFVQFSCIKIFKWEMKSLFFQSNPKFRFGIILTPRVSDHQPKKIAPRLKYFKQNFLSYSERRQLTSVGTLECVQDKNNRKVAQITTQYINMPRYKMCFVFSKVYAVRVATKRFFFVVFKNMTNSPTFAFLIHFSCKRTGLLLQHRGL